MSEALDNLAQRFSLPPALVAALESVPVPKGLLATYGVSEQSVKTNPIAGLTVLAHAVSQSFAENGSIQQALSHALTGDPNAHQSPTTPVGGQIAHIMSSAALNATAGLSGFQPADPRRFAHVGEDFAKFMHTTAQMGGAVTEGHVSAFEKATKAVAPQSMNTGRTVSQPGVMTGAPKPKGPDPAEVEAFAGQMKGLGIDVDHFLQHFPLFSGLRYKMLSAHTGLEDFAPTMGMNQAEIVQHVRDQPHPTYTHITAGQYADAKDLANMHSITHRGQTAAASDIARFAATKANWQQVQSHYADTATPQVKAGLNA